MRFRFSKKISLTCLILAVLMLRLSFWQWTRHLDKKSYIELLNSRLERPVTKLTELTEAELAAWPNLTHRRLAISGSYDFSNEMLLMNRSYGDYQGVHVLTPLKINNQTAILVDRGFLPLQQSRQFERKLFQRPKKVSFTGLVKEPKQKTFFLAPSDPETGPNKPWADAFLRVDLERIQKQLPYKLLPFYVEIMNTEAGAQVTNQIVKSDSKKNDLFFLPMKMDQIAGKPDLDPKLLPIATFDTVIPPGRHFGYVFEWGVMALMTILIGIVLQFRRPSRIPSPHPLDNLDTKK
jgi:cytochrome oxidase assembly protein ShyY1